MPRRFVFGTTLDFVAASGSARAAVRTLRSAPWASLQHVSETASVKPSTLHRRLDGLRQRGDCAAAAKSTIAALAASSTEVPHRWSLPGVFRLMQRSWDEPLPTALQARSNMGELFHGTAAWHLRTLGGGPGTLPSAVRAAAVSTDHGKRVLAASCWAVGGEIAPPATLARLAADPESEVRRWVAGNAGCPAAVMGLMSLAEDETLRRTVAGNAGCPPEVLARLVGDRDEDVCEAAVRNPACPHATLLRLGYGENDTEFYRWHVAHNPNCPPELLEDLTNDIDIDVAMAAAHNPNCSLETVMGLAEHPDEHLRATAAQHPLCPPRWLQELAGDDDSDVRYWAALHPSCPSESLALLASDPLPAVRHAASIQRG